MGLNLEGIRNEITKCAGSLTDYSQNDRNMRAWIAEQLVGGDGKSGLVADIDELIEAEKKVKARPTEPASRQQNQQQPQMAGQQR